MSVKIIKNIDTVLGTIACAIIAPFKPFSRIDVNKIDSILIIQLWGIGETILTIPAIKAVRKKFPKAKITILATKRNKAVYNHVENMRVLPLNPLEILSFIVNNVNKYDLVIDMEEYLNISAIMAMVVGKSSIGYSHGQRAKLYTETVVYNDLQHCSQTFYDLVRILNIKGKVTKLFPVKTTDEAKSNVEKLFKLKGIKPSDNIIGITAGAAESSRSRMWPKDRFKVVVKQLSKRKKTKVIIFGTKSEKEINQYISSKESIDLTGLLNVSELIHAISKCNTYLTNDTGPMHIAAAMDIKTVALFGPNLPMRFGPPNAKSISIYHKQECSPCINVHKGQVPDCIFKGKDYQKCMKAISVEEVLKEI